MGRLTRGWGVWMWEQLFTGLANMRMTTQSIVGSKPQTPRTIPAGGSAFVVRTGETFGPGAESPFARKVETWTTLDLILNYTFNYPAPAPAEVPGYAKDGGKNVKMKDGKDKQRLSRDSPLLNMAATTGNGGLTTPR